MTALCVEIWDLLLQCVKWFPIFPLRWTSTFPCVRTVQIIWASSNWWQVNWMMRKPQVYLNLSTQNSLISTWFLKYYFMQKGKRLLVFECISLSVFGRRVVQLVLLNLLFYFIWPVKENVKWNTVEVWLFYTDKIILNWKGLTPDLHLKF